MPNPSAQPYILYSVEILRCVPVLYKSFCCLNYTLEIDVVSRAHRIFMLVQVYRVYSGQVKRDIFAYPHQWMGCLPQYIASWSRSSGCVMLIPPASALNLTYPIVETNISQTHSVTQRCEETEICVQGTKVIRKRHLLLKRRTEQRPANAGMKQPKKNQSQPVHLPGRNHLYIRLTRRVGYRTARLRHNLRDITE